MDNTTQNVDPGLSYHLEDFTNPHMVTKEQVGLGNVDDVKQYSELNPPPNYIESVCSKKPDATGNIKLVKGDVGLGKVDNLKQYSEVNPPPYPVTSVNGMTGAVNVEMPDISGVQTDINVHVENVCNPHAVTKEQIGLGNVDNTTDLSKPISTATQTALNAKLNTSIYTGADILNKIKTVDGSGSGLDADLLDGRNAANAANSIPVLDGAGKLPIAQVPTGATATTVSLGNHGHSYLPLSGGTVTGTTNFSGALRQGGKDVAITEKGTWAPQATNITFSNSDKGIYVRTGNTVTLMYYGYVTNRNTSAGGGIEIKGLPYAPKNGAYIGQVGYFTGDTYLNPNKNTPVTNLVLNMARGGFIYLAGWGYGGRSWIVNNDGAYWSNKEISFSISYEI